MPPTPPRILVVEDDHDTRTGVRDLLFRHGYEVQTANDGREALGRLLDEELPALMILDVRMPGMDGRELLTITRAYHRLAMIPVMVLSAAPLPGAMLESVKAVMRKPFDPDLLVETVQRLMVREGVSVETRNDAESGAPLAILIVDDNVANLAALEATLEPLGEHIVRARSGREALAAVERQPFALVLLDVRMPDLDGFTTAAIIRKHDHARDTPIIFVTAIDTNPDDARRGLSLGAIDYIYKPYDGEVLLNKVRSLVTLHRDREARRRAETALQMKDLILGVIGHDLLSPLTAIQTSAHLALRDPAGHPESIARIQSAARRMERMITSLVDYARSYGGGRFHLTATSLRMDDLCRDVVDEALAAHPDRRIDLSVRGDPSGRWDGDRVIQAVGNLVSNAIKHSRSDVRLEVDGQPEEVLVTVESVGAPFPDTVRARLFAPFQKGALEQPGLGLGLYIVREIVVAHGGSVALVAPPGDPRTRFEVRWPRMPTPNAES